MSEICGQKRLEGVGGLAQGSRAPGWEDRGSG
jgi:hypothetical protein